MKLFYYCTREFDELEICRECAEKYGIEFDYTTRYPTLENAELARGADAIGFTPCDMGTAMVERFAQLGVKYLLCHSIGFDHVDIRRARELGMRVSNVGYPPSGVAEYAIMLMLMCERKMAYTLKCSENQDYGLRGKMGRDFTHLTVGVIGTGNIGGAVVEHLSGFGCRLLAYDAFPREKVAQWATYVSLEELLAQSDVITLHTPHNAQTHHLINAQTLAQMKPGVTLVNTARGALIDTEALIDALESGRVGAAGLDVLEQENGLYYYSRKGEVIANRSMAVLRSMPNVILTPHTAFYTDVNVRAMIEGNFISLSNMAAGREDPHELK